MEARMKIRNAGLALIAVLGMLAMTPAGAQELKKDKDKITRAEIEASPQKDQDIYQVIRNLRPHFLRQARGIRSFGNAGAVSPTLYVDGFRESDLNSLKAIPAAAVEEVRYLDPSRAESDYGSDAQGGAVVLKRLKLGSSSTPTTPAPKDTTKPPQL
jgi:hypothetical protein